MGKSASCFNNKSCSKKSKWQNDEFQREKYIKFHGFDCKMRIILHGRSVIGLKRKDGCGY